MLNQRRKERRLLRQIRAGEREACEEFVRQNYAQIYRFLFHLAGDEALAEDLTQETFAAAWKGIGTFRASSSLATWLHRIAYTRFIDSRRALQRQAAAAVRPNLQENRPPDYPSPLDRLLADERSRRLYRAIQDLAEADRLVIVLHYLQGLTLRQTAAALNEPVGTVKWKTNHALSRLRASLNGKV